MLKSTRRMLFFIPPSAVSASARSYRYLAQVHQGDGSLFHPPDATLWGDERSRSCVFQRQGENHDS